MMRFLRHQLTLDQAAMVAHVVALMLMRILILITDIAEPSTIICIHRIRRKLVVVSGHPVLYRHPYQLQHVTLSHDSGWAFTTRPGQADRFLTHLHCVQH